MSQDETNPTTNGIADQMTAEEILETLEAANSGQPAGSAAPDEEVAALRVHLNEANQRADAEREAGLRVRADFANFKRRTEEEKEGLRALLVSDLLTRLLPLVDNFERALAAAAVTDDYQKLIGGVNATYRQMQEFLVREGVAPIEAVGQPFDPKLHDAVLREETTEYPENTIIEELQRGYTLNGKVLRPTMVKVAAGDA